MSEISLRELYELYLDTLGRCTSDIRNRSDEGILYDLFEEFDVGVHSFFHTDNLAKLQTAGYIDDEMLRLSNEVRRKWLGLQHGGWTIQQIKTEKEWQELFELCDQLRLKLKDRD